MCGTTSFLRQSSSIAGGGSTLADGCLGSSSPFVECLLKWVGKRLESVGINRNAIEQA